MNEVVKHLTYMTSLAKQLHELKEKITWHKFATVLLGSLPESYDTGNFMDELKWDNVKGLQEARRIRRQAV